jgi:hypothetical protein
MASTSAPTTHVVFELVVTLESGMALPAPDAARAFANAAGLSSTSITSNAILRSPRPRSSARHALHHFAP